MPSASRKNLIERAWRSGQLSYKLKPHQLPIYDAIQDASENSKTLKLGMSCTRRGGKTFTLLLDASEFAIKNPKSQMRFCAPSQRSIQETIIPIMDIIHSDCPEDMKPVWKFHKSRYEWANGTTMSIAGTDGGNYKNLRGHNSHRNYIDEAGSADKLRHIYRSILLPQTLTTKGLTIMASTPR